jgi:hypothetical protein
LKVKGLGDRDPFNLHLLTLKSSAMPEKPSPASGPELDLSPYMGCWVALVRGQVAGVGVSADAALRAAKHTRPREEPVVILVRHMPPTQE